MLLAREARELCSSEREVYLDKREETKRDKNGIDVCGFVHYFSLTVFIG